MKKQTVLLRPSNVSKILVCIDGRKDCDYTGYLWNPYYKSPTQFFGMFEMIKQMEKIMDDFYFPEPAFSFQPFHQSKNCHLNKKKIREVHRFMSDDIFKEQSGEQATFVVHVQFRQNATWQGSIEWLEEKTNRKFRSMLEMMKLMDEALASNQEINDEITWEEQSHQAI